MAISALFLAPCAVRADMLTIPEPPHKMVLKGTLSLAANHWWNIEKKCLNLTTADGETIHLGPAGKINEKKTGNPIVSDTYIGKQVAVTLIGTRQEQHSQEIMRGEPPHPVVIQKVISLTLAK